MTNAAPPRPCCDGRCKRGMSPWVCVRPNGHPGPCAWAVTETVDSVTRSYLQGLITRDVQ